MKLLFILLSFFVSHTTDCSGIEEIRSTYHKIETNEDLKNFIVLARTINCQQTIPYVASCIMKKAENTFWPYKKLKYFNEGKKLLEDYILKNPTNLEARYVRFLVQNRVPFFLGYHKDQDLDKKFIEVNIEHAALPEAYKKTIVYTIKKLTEEK